MPLYPFSCENNHKHERFIPITENVSLSQCPECGVLARQDYAAKRVQNGLVDGPHTGYYSDELGFPVDPTNPLKRVCPSKRAFDEATKRAEERTKGAVGRAD